MSYYLSANMNYQTIIMKTFFSIKTATKFAFLFIGISTFFFACKKTSDVDTPIDPVITITPSDLTTKVTAAVISGFVTDGNDIAVKNASVQIGNSTVLSDKYGYFEARNILVVQNAAVVTVTKTGFFKGIKTFIAATNKAAFFRIKLIPKTVAGTVNATAGGTIVVTGSLLISFPANAIVNASTNAVYTGTVNVTAYKIDPTNADLPRIMPGDLRGLNTDNQLQILTSYGMAAVELTGAGGELLQIAAGKKATMTMPIPATIIASAPATIPLWYFDETIGLWKQEGTATKTGNNYVGDVSHFSFWNYDVPANYVQFNCTVVNTAGQPVQNAYVKISLVSNPNNAGYGYTDSSGYINGAVPNNAQLKLEVFANASCGGAAAFSQNFSTTNVNVAFGNATINTTTSIATLTGSVKNCAGLPVTNGYVILKDGNFYSRSQLTINGNYSLNKLVCNFPYTVTIIGEDISTLQQSLPISYVINNSGINNIPIINACMVSIQQFLNYTVDGVSNSYISPQDSITHAIGTSSSIWTHFMQLDRIPSTPLSASFISFDTVGIGLGSMQVLRRFNVTPYSLSNFSNNSLLVSITEYGPNPGQYIAGNFSGILTSAVNPFPQYNVSFSFRFKRRY